MTAPLVYIAAPLGAPTPTLRRWHRERARLLACLAFAMGRIPVWVHEVAERALGDDTDPEARDRGMILSLDAVRRVFLSNGYFWCLRRDDDGLSPGSNGERFLWEDLQRNLPGYMPIMSKWCEWRQLCVETAPHLVAEWDRLATPPTEPVAVDGVTP